MSYRSHSSLIGKQKGREKMLSNILLSLALFLGVVAVCAQVYLNLKVVAESEAENKLERAIAKATKPVVKVEISTKGEW